ncbi:hypothetical protein HDU99_001741, partial [Rhizoclosmatium hyalinum]
MTTAARPTWLPAVGGGSLRDTGGAPTQQRSAKELPAHTQIKLRQTGQNAPGERLDREALKQKLLAAERAAKAAAAGGVAIDEEQLEQKRRELLAENPDADDDVDDDPDEEEEKEDDEDDEDDDSDDDEAELMRELEKIKRERAEEKERLEKEKREEEERAREEAMLAGNPLLNQGASSSAVTVSGGFAVKRRWDDDVIFKNQSRGVEERPKKRFVNDLLRSDFHRKFMSK